MKSHGFYPTEIIFSPTNACNLHCEHCFVGRNPHKLEINDAISLIENCVKYGGQPDSDGNPLPVLERVGFSGGEPFLYMDFLLQITKACLDHDLLFDQIMTNGDWWQDESELYENFIHFTMQATMEKSDFPGIPTTARKTSACKLLLQKFRKFLAPIP